MDAESALTEFESDSEPSNLPVAALGFSNQQAEGSGDTDDGGTGGDGSSSDTGEGSSGDSNHNTCDNTCENTCGPIANNPALLFDHFKIFELYEESGNNVWFDQDDILVGGMIVFYDADGDEIGRIYFKDGSPVDEDGNPYTASDVPHDYVSHVATIHSPEELQEFVSNTLGASFNPIDNPSGIDINAPNLPNNDGIGSTGTLNDNKAATISGMEVWILTGNWTSTLEEYDNALAAARKRIADGFAAGGKSGAAGAGGGSVSGGYVGGAMGLAVGGPGVVVGGGIGAGIGAAVGGFSGFWVGCYNPEADDYDLYYYGFATGLSAGFSSGATIAGGIKGYNQCLAQKNIYKNVGDDIRIWLGDDYIVKRYDGKGFVAINSKGTRKFRMDFDGHGYPTHGHLEVWDAARQRWIDAIPEKHHLPFK